MQRDFSDESDNSITGRIANVLNRVLESYIITREAAD